MHDPIIFRLSYRLRRKFLLPEVILWDYMCERIFRQVYQLMKQLEEYISKADWRLPLTRSMSELVLAHCEVEVWRWSLIILIRECIGMVLNYIVWEHRILRGDFLTNK